LYFSSQGLAGMGKSDIFVTRKDSAGNWSKPINLGYPINTEGRDWSLIVAPDGKTAIYSAQRPDDTHGGLDLYSFTLPDYARAIPTTFVRGIVRDALTKKPIANAICNLTDLKTQKTTSEIRTDSSGSFLMPLPTDRNYGFNASAKNYLFYSDNFSLKGLFSSEKPFEITADLNLPKKEEAKKDQPMTAKTGNSIVLRNVFFNTSSYELLPESFGELNRLVDLLNENPTIKIQIGGHTDTDGSEKANLLLSERRAASVRDYLIRMGIENQRLTAKGFGESQPIDTTDTPEGKARNRRTEFMVL
jgi:outer membrane protein OmpA-like peptidoglycan-associated protein